VSRNEYLDWAKTRARAHLVLGEVKLAVLSIMSDLNGRADTAFSTNSIIGQLGLKAAKSGDTNEASRFIEGFR